MRWRFHWAKGVSLDIRFCIVVLVGGRSCLLNVEVNPDLGDEVKQIELDQRIMDTRSSSKNKKKMQMQSQYINSF